MDSKPRPLSGQPRDWVSKARRARQRRSRRPYHRKVVAGAPAVSAPLPGWTVSAELVDPRAGVIRLTFTPPADSPASDAA